MIGFYETTVPPDNIIPKDTFSSLHIYLHEIGEEDLARFLDNLFAWNNTKTPWREWKNERGKWTKRFAAAYKEASGKVIPDDVMGKIGEYLGTKVNTEDVTLHFEIAKFSDWKHGAFEGKTSADGSPPGSCWWDNWSAHRLGMVKHKGGYSVLFYKNKADYEKNKQVKGIGRCWMYEEGGVKYIFNAYGVHLRRIAEALTKALNQDGYKLVEVNAIPFINQGYLDNEGRGGGRTGIGYAIGSKENIALVREISLPDFSSIPDTNCIFCEREINSRKSTRIRDGFACTPCVKAHCIMCANCHEWTDTPFRIAGVVNDVCKRCYDRAPTCSFHGKTRYATRRIWHTQRMCCNLCIMEQKVIQCQSCSRYFDKYVDLKTGTMAPIQLCISCNSKIKVVQHG